MSTGIPSAAEELARRHRPTQRSKPPQPTLLHVLHSWGGGIARWTEDFIHHTPEQRHFILYSRGDRNVFGRELELVDPARPGVPLALWELTPPIRATDIAHPTYAAILKELLAGFALEAVVVSSLIGHSLEALTTGLPTLRVLHDFYPYCPAMFGYFDASCERCEPERLATCLRSNPRNECWHNSAPKDWLALRQAYANALLKPQVRFVAPTRTVRDRFYRLYPEIAGKTCHIIAHGIDLKRIGGAVPPLPPQLAAEQPTNLSFQTTGAHSLGKSRKLRIVVPGRLEPHKGLQLLRDALPRLIHQAEFLLLGCGLFGQSFADLDHITIVPDYNSADLGPLIRDFAPDCALLLSILPETFSYTLSEMAALGIPPLATNLGAFAERIRHGINGFLYEPDLQALTALVISLAKDRSPLLTIAQYLRTCPIRQAKEMARDYQALLSTAPATAATAETPGWLALGVEKAQTQLYGKYAALEQEALHQDRELQEAHGQIAALNQKLEHHQARATALEQELNVLHRSNSWRLTAPLRIITMTLRAWRTRLHSKFFIPANPGPSLPTAGRRIEKEVPSQRDGGWDDPPFSTPPAPFPGNSPGKASFSSLSSHSQDAPAQTQAREDVRQSHKLLRIRLRERLAIPDAARVVLGVTQENRPEAVQAFIQASATLANCRRDLYFLWLEGENTPPLPPEQKELGLAAAPRRLFFEKATASTLPAYLTASDLLYLPDGGDKKFPPPAAITALEAPIISSPTGDNLATLLIRALQDS